MKQAQASTVPTHAYPRPQLERKEWTSLNGTWEFAIDTDGRLARPADVVWNRTIQIPFSPETDASGIGDRGLFYGCWYRRSLQLAPVARPERVLLHFGAVDYRTTVWIDGARAGTHEGGYTPFTFDITDLLKEGTGHCEIVVRAEDDPTDLAKPRGKQDWQPDPHSIWYHRTSGIWQTVWLEWVPFQHIDHVRWTPNIERWEIACAVWVHGAGTDSLQLGVRLQAGGIVLADDSYLIVSGEVHRRIALSDPGIDDYRNALLWSPSSPSLIEAELCLRTSTGEVIDRVRSYTALRSITVEGDRFVLNGRPYILRLVLDQGYWPATGLTAPDDDALRRDVELAKAMGFNGVRKHQKIEDPRYLFWADRLGLLVWEEMPSCYRFTLDSVERATREWMAVIHRDYSHPCVVTWVPFNESWGVPNLPTNAAERNYVRALYHLTKTLDPTRPVIGNDGWESVATDMIGIHDYDPSPGRIARRYHAEETRPKLFARERPGGRMLVLDDQHVDQPVVLTEFGGIAYANDPAGTWGYSRAQSCEELGDRFRALLAVVHDIGLFAGYCYTQFADTYQEANGLLFSDRTPKVPLATINMATTGAASDGTQTAGSAPISSPRVADADKQE